jgi:hypothetical protein
MKKGIIFNQHTEPFRELVLALVVVLDEILDLAVNLELVMTLHSI